MQNAGIGICFLFIVHNLYWHWSHVYHDINWYWLIARPYVVISLAKHGNFSLRNLNSKLRKHTWEKLKMVFAFVLAVRKLILALFVVKSNCKMCILWGLSLTLSHIQCTVAVQLQLSRLVHNRATKNAIPYQETWSTSSFFNQSFW